MFNILFKVNQVQYNSTLHVCVQLHTMSTFNRHANIPRGHLKLSTRPLMGKFMFILPQLVTASSGGQKKSVLSPIFLFPVLINPSYPHSINFSPAPLAVSLARLAPLPPPPSFFHCSSPLPSHSNLLVWKVFPEKGMWVDMWEWWIVSWMLYFVISPRHKMGGVKVGGAAGSGRSDSGRAGWGSVGEGGQVQVPLKGDVDGEWGRSLWLLTVKNESCANVYLLLQALIITSSCIFNEFQF